MDKINQVYISADGAWGDAHNLHVVKLSDEQVSNLTTMSKSDAFNWLSSVTDPYLVVKSFNDGE